MNSHSSVLPRVLAVLCLATMAVAQKPPTRLDWRAVHDSAIVIDGHADTPQRFVYEHFDMGMVTPVTEGHLDLVKALHGNLGAQFFAVSANPRFGAEYARRAMDQIDSVYEQVRVHPQQMMMAYSAADIVRARSGPSKRLAALLAIEGGHIIENDLRLLRQFYKLGVRYMTLTWANTNEWADSSGDQDIPSVRHHGGLTPFGKQVILEMNRLGMMIDVSHVSDKTFWDAVATSRTPVIASHSATRALTNNLRNLTDEMLGAIAKNDGLVMVCFSSAFVDQKFLDDYLSQTPEREAAYSALEADLKRQGKEPTRRMRNELTKAWAAKIKRPPLDSLIDHIDHVVKVAGIDHVGLGSDFDGIDSLPEGIDSVADLPKITRELSKRGYGHDEIRKILGGNLLRVFRATERVSRQMRASGLGQSEIDAQDGSASEYVPLRGAATELATADSARL